MMPTHGHPKATYQQDSLYALIHGGTRQIWIVVERGPINSAAIHMKTAGQYDIFILSILLFKKFSQNALHIKIILIFKSSWVTETDTRSFWSLE